MLQVYIQMRVEGARSSSAPLQCVHFCYISYYTLTVQKCIEDCQAIPGTDTADGTTINQVATLTIEPDDFRITPYHFNPSRNIGRNFSGMRALMAVKIIRRSRFYRKNNGVNGF